MQKSFIESKYFTIFLHFLIWSTFFTLQMLSFQASIADRPPRFESLDLNRFYYRFIFQSIIMVSIYYLNAIVYIPHLLFKNKAIKYILVLVLTIIIVIGIDYIFSNFFEYRRRMFGKVPSIIIFISIFIIAVSTSIKLAQKWFENETQRKAMIHEKMNSELSLLKTQVNPHFLFNTLNGIYSLANAKSDKTAHAVVKLSQLMRYMLDDSKQNFVPLSSELDYIDTFIELQKLRLFDNVKVEFNVNGETDNIRIQPLLLIPFIENAFKHGTDSTSNCLINIDLDVKDGSIQLIVKNDIIKSRNEDGNSGFGLSNIKRRLKLEYPDQHVLTTNTVENKFIVKLFISIK
jgi:two-component system, LytTR family, sensor kinase